MQMFQSATLKLTAWYLAILMTISITFSIVIYQLNYREISFRLENLQHSLIDEGASESLNGTAIQLFEGPNSPLFVQSSQAASQMTLSLIYINLVVLIAGGLGSYFLARRTLRPIEESHEAQSRFTSDASHELRTPLAAMKTELEVSLRDPKLSIAESRELLESNLEEVNKLIDLSEMLLTLSQLNDDKLVRSELDVIALYKEKIKHYSEFKHRFKLTTRRKKAVILANEPAILELIGILIDNAIKYSPEDSTIDVKIYERRGSVGFEIHNIGESIPEDKIPRIFDRFYRADNSRTKTGNHGYGLGLSIAKRIVDIHHGDITVISGDKGTTFTVLLPAYKRSQLKLPNTSL